MGLLQKIRTFLARERLPEDTKLLLTGVDSVAALRKGLDDIITRNEVEAKEAEREIEKLAKIEDEEKERIRGGSLNEREKTHALRYVKRLRHRMDSYQKVLKIHEDNIDLHMGILDKINEMEAMELKAVTQQQIEEIAVDHEERLEKHKEIVAAGRVAQEGESGEYEDVAEKRELEELEREIVGEKPPAEAQKKEPEKEEPARVVPERTPIDEALEKKKVAQPAEVEEEEGERRELELE